MKGLTPRQERALGIFRERAALGLLPPQVREVGKEMGYASVETCHDILLALAKKGYLTYRPFKRPAFVLAEAPSPIDIMKTAWNAANLQERNEFSDWLDGNKDF